MRSPPSPALHAAQSDGSGIRGWVEERVLIGLLGDGGGLSVAARRGEEHKGGKLGDDDLLFHRGRVFWPCSHGGCMCNNIPFSPLICYLHCFFLTTINRKKLLALCQLCSAHMDRSNRPRSGSM